MFDVALAIVLNSDDNDQTVPSIQLADSIAYLVIAAFVGMMVPVARKVDCIENQMVVNIPLVNMSGKHKLILADVDK